MKLHKKICTLSAAMVLTLPFMSAVPAVFAEGTPTIYINEVCTGNNGENGNVTFATDTSGEYCDWIELYNPTDSDVDISGWKLVKDGTSEYEFNNTVVAAGEYKLVFCCKKYAGSDSYANAGYNLSGDGVTLALNNGSEDVDTVTVPALDKDTVYARQPDGSDSLSLLMPTPEGSNNEAKSAIPCNAPILSAESGMYKSAFELTMTTDAGNKIYYTTDGSDPASSDTRIEYEAPLNIKNRSSEKAVLARMVKVSEITPWSDSASLPKNSAVDKGTVIRACTLSAAGEYSDTVTKSYFVGVSNADHNDLPILSITTDTDNLFDYEKGIYVKGKVYAESSSANKNSDNPEANYNQRGREWERECHIDFFESDGTLALSQDCGMRTQGAYSRAAYQKSFRFYARDEYGEKNFKYEFFSGLTKEDGSGEPLTKFKKLVVRNGGNDNDYLKFKDSYLQSLVSDRAFDTQTGRPCVVFIDGEYWGLYTLQEDYDDSYFENNYGVDKDEVIVYKKGEIDEGLEEDIAFADELYNFAKSHDMSVKENYEKISGMLDIQSFIDYMASEIYINNEDWPGNNYALWRVRNTDSENPYADGRWRMLYYDTEMGVDHYGNYSTKYNKNNLKKVVSNNKDFLPVIFNSLMKNSSFKEQFVTSFMDQANVNYNFDRCQEILQDFTDAYVPELDNSFNRFPTWANRWNASNPCYDRMVTFLKKRPTYAAKMLSETLGLKEAADLKITAVNPEGGTVTVNTSTLELDKYSFSGKYFPDYKVTVTAEPAEGYTFKCWAGTVSSTSKTLTLTMDKATTLQAVFVKAGETVHKATFTDGKTVFTSYVKDNGTLSAPSELYSKTGYTLKWDKSLSGIKSDVTLNAVYTPITYTIKYNANGGSGSVYTQTLTYDKTQSLTKSKFTRSGYVFMGWSKSKSGEVVYTDGKSVKNLADKSKTIYLYAVWKKDVSKCSVAAVSDRICTGSAIKPAVTVKSGSTVLKYGTDYTLSYSNNTKIGKGVITIKGKGDYAGTKKVTFKIKPAKVTNLTASRAETSIRIKWSAVKGAESYQVYKLQSNGSYKLIATVKDTQYKESGLKAGQKCVYKVRAKTGSYVGECGRIATCSKTKVPALKASAGTKKSSLSWSKRSEASGYQIVMATSKDGKYTSVKTVTSKSTLKYTKSGLTSGKTYYFKIRSYKVVEGKKLYGNYSSPVKVKIK